MTRFDSTVEILGQLLTDGKITDEDIAEAKSKVLTFEMRETIDMLHSTFCTLNHDTGECGWYEEEHAPPGERLKWNSPYHFAWANLFRDFLASTKLVKFIPESVGEESSSGTDGGPLSD